LNRGELVKSEGKALAATVQTTVPASDATYDVPLPLGAYHVAVLVDSDVTGTTTAIAVSALTNEAGTQAASIPFRVLEPGASSVAAALTLTAADEGRYAVVVPTGVATPAAIPLANGLRVSVAKGGAVEGERCVVTVVAARVP
jgi:hypothetical protein